GALVEGPSCDPGQGCHVIGALKLRRRAIGGGKEWIPLLSFLNSLGPKPLPPPFIGLRVGLPCDRSWRVVVAPTRGPAAGAAGLSVIGVAGYGSGRYSAGTPATARSVSRD